jgi:Flp pilus assembly pilin Flp
MHSVLDLLWHTPCISTWRPGYKKFSAKKFLDGGDLKMTFAQFVKNLHREESGQDLLEYALVLAAVLTAVVAGSASLATDISTALTTINTKIQTAIAG